MYSKTQPFDEMYDDEKVAVFARKHWLVFLGNVLVTFLLLLVPIVIYVVINFYLSDVLAGISYNYYFIGASVYYLFVISYYIAGFIDFYFDLVIVTNYRVVDIRQDGLFHRSVDESDLIKIEDVRVNTKGFFATLFNLGDVEVQTAGSARNFSFRAIPNSQMIARKIMDLYEKKLKERRGSDFQSDHTTPAGFIISDSQTKEPDEPKNSQSGILNEGEEVKFNQKD